MKRNGEMGLKRRMEMGRRGRMAAFWISVLLLLNGCVATQADIRQSKKLYNLSLQQASRRNYREALLLLTKANELNSRNYWIKEAMGGVLMKLGHPKKALPFYKEATTIYKRSPRAWNNLGTAYMVLKRYDKAIETFQQALKNVLYETPCFAQLNLGRAYHKAKKYNKAILWLRKGVRNCPRMCQGYRLLGLSCMDQKRYKLAQYSFQQLTKRCKKFPPGFFWLAKSLVKQKRYQEARVALKKCIAFGEKAGFSLKQSCEELDKKLRRSLASR
jgi:tetratricopeptide (TPR) repeat protein